MTEEFRAYSGNLSKAHTELNTVRDEIKTEAIFYNALKLRLAVAIVHCLIELTAQVRDYVKHVTSDK